MKRIDEEPKIHKWLAEPLPRSVSESLQRLASLEDVRYLAVMPDVHLAKDVCIGTVLATKELIYPAAVGGDIGCGMAALPFNASADLLDDERRASQLLLDLHRCIPPIRHPKATMPDELPNDLVASALSHSRLEKLKRRDARVQFGTLGRGNHFLEFQADQDGQLWLMVHSGSRGIGQAVTQHHLAVATQRSRGIPFFSSNSEDGRAYLNDQAWCLRYAELNRIAMAEAVGALFEYRFGVSFDESRSISCHHNHVRQETHFGESFWVHRKGAQSARKGEAGVVPGSMGSPSFHVEGRGCELAFQSCSHGAGRKLSRTEARRTISVRTMRKQMKGVWFEQQRSAELRDESPSAYKDILSVMRAQHELAKTTRRLRPILSYKG